MILIGVMVLLVIALELAVGIYLLWQLVLYFGAI